MSDTYTDFELINLTKIPEIILYKKITLNSVHKNLIWMRKLQKSLYEFSKKNKHLFDIQMEIVAIIRHVERFCYPYLYQDALNQVKIKYTQETDSRKKEIAKGMAEKTLRKFSY